MSNKKKFVILHITNMLVDPTYSVSVKTTYNQEETPVFDVLSLGEHTNIVVDSLPREGAYNYLVFKQRVLLEHGSISRSKIEQEVKRYYSLNEE